jgi:enoyl-CoA hydratase/carnithine racemase
MTGTGNTFIEEISPETLSERLPKSKITPTVWDHIYSDAKRLIMNLLDIEVPVIAAVNGPVNIHAELAVLSDIVLASENAAFQDAPHFPNGLVPGDGVHVIWPYLLGRNRGRYFLLTGERLSAQEALRLGVVAEVLPAEKLLPRAHELAKQILKQPPITIRYARVVMTQELKTLMLEHLSHGLALKVWRQTNIGPDSWGPMKTRGPGAEQRDSYRHERSQPQQDPTVNIRGKRP